MVRPALIALLTLLMTGNLLAASAQVEPAIRFGDDPSISEAGMGLTVFASGLNFPMGMIGLPDNSVLVATSNPTGGSFFQSTGELVRLIDADGDGVADDGGITVATGLEGPLVAIQRAGELIFVTTAASDREGIYVLRRGDHWKSPMFLLGKISVSSPGALHRTYGLAVRRNPMDTNGYQLFFNTGSFGNMERGKSPVVLSGLVEGELEDSSIYKFDITDVDGTVSFSLPEQVASGLRNASALHFDQESGDLIIGENGMDTPGNEIVSFSADEIDRIPVAGIGQEVPDFGFPDSYIAYPGGEVVGDSGQQPELAFTPIDGDESEGIAAVAQIPASFPAPFGNGYVAGFHGQYDSAGSDNEENPLIFFSLTTGERFVLISNDNPSVGHLDSATGIDDALYVADLCSGGFLTEANACGVIYRIAPSD